MLFSLDGAQQKRRRIHLGEMPTKYYVILARRTGDYGRDKYPQ